MALVDYSDVQGLVRYGWADDGSVLPFAPNR